MSFGRSAASVVQGISGNFGSWGSLDWARETRVVREAVRQALSSMFNGSAGYAGFLPSLQTPVRHAFNQPPMDLGHPGIKLSRFEDLKAHLLQTTLPNMYKEAIVNLRDRDRILDEVEHHLAAWSGYSIMSTDLRSLDRIIKGCFIQEFVRLLEQDLPNAKLPSGFKIREDWYHTSSRAEIQAKLRKLQAAKQIIQGLT